MTDLVIDDGYMSKRLKYKITVSEKFLPEYKRIVCFHFCLVSSWSRNGHKLVSASTDNNVCIWDILSGECEQKYRFPSPILKVNLNEFLMSQFI